MSSTQPEPHVQIIAHYRVAQGKEDEVLALLGRLAAASRDEPANLSYAFFRNSEDPSHIVVLERYTDAAGFAAHRESEHFANLARQEIIPRLVDRQVHVYESSGNST